MTRAILESYNQTPRKVRLVSNLTKGKKVADALAALEFLPRRTAEPIAKLIKSAVANASAGGVSASGGK
ncbi:50S ribosomal protein L22, partial [Patescibacteria group bacterium]|nr:50S ribosomal protein L22 [Patescibacteria group bacterium]